MEADVGLTAEQTLMNECEALWLSVYETHAKIQSRNDNNNSLQSMSSDDSDDSLVYRNILKAKEKELQAACTVIETTGIEVPTADKGCIELLTKEQIANNTSQLEDTLLIIKSQRKEVTDQLEREKEILERHVEIQNALLEKIAKLEHEKENVQSKNSQTRDLERKTRKAEAQLKQLMKKLGGFMKEHFPLPSADDIKTKTKAKSVLHGQQILDPNVQYVSLQQMLEVLMNKLYDKPHDPYVRLETYHWAPYIELLLRCGIVHRHPQDSNLVKLESFHL